MSAINRTTFYAYVRRAPFGGRLTPQQFKGIEVILNEWDRQYSREDPRWLAYTLATVQHETDGKFEPVREGRDCKTDAASRRAVAALAVKRGPNSAVAKYAKPDPKTGHVYYGRGFPQLTHAENYQKFGELLGLPLYEDPDLALLPDVSVKILFLGMTRGLFTGARLGGYFNATTNNPIGARRIVNGNDKADLISTLHAQFLAAIVEATKAEEVGEPPADVMPVMAEPDGPTGVGMATDKAGAGAITLAGAASSGGILSMLVGAINSPWAVLGLAIILIASGVGLWLYFSGRIDLRRKGGV